MFEGTWRSVAGAELRLWQFGEAVSGTYAAGQAEAMPPHRGRILVGMAEGNVIGFVTASGASHTIRSWAGRIYPSEGGMGFELHLVSQTVGQQTSRVKFSRSVKLETVVFTQVTVD
ncbi:avidin/streptavidin family protein [Methylobacterium sp. CM6247]